MKKHESVNWESLDRLDGHLWLTAITLVIVLGISLVGFMFPSVFWFGKELPFQAPERFFFSFCILLALVLIYLIQRQATLRSLKRKLFEAQTALRGTQREISMRVFLALPERTQFQDALAMEFRRAAASGSQLSQVAFHLNGATRDQVALLASALTTLVRKGETIYRLDEHSIVVILPNTSLQAAAAFSNQVTKLAEMENDSIRTSVASYPEGVSSLTELEGGLMRMPVSRQLGALLTNSQ